MILKNKFTENSGCWSARQKKQLGIEKPPTKLHASIGGYFGPSYSVELDSDGNLIYQSNPHGFTELGDTRQKIAVSKKMWSRFREQIDESKIWTWKKQYVDPDILDGVGWELKITYDDKTIETYGSNAFPVKKQFDAFLGSVSELVGGKPFK